VIDKCRSAEIHERIHSLTSQVYLTPDQRIELETINQDFTKILIAANQKCIKKELILGLHSSTKHTSSTTTGP